NGDSLLSSITPIRRWPEECRRLPVLRGADSRAAASCGRETSWRRPMSEHAMSDFLAAAVKDAALSGRIREAVAGNERIVAVQTIADLAASAGYEVGPADVEAFRL